NAVPTNERIAGTGTISYDGTVGPIEGARQKVIAAKYAGATLFLVPTDNYSEVRDMPGIRIVPVSNFNHALASICIEKKR
ncbi:MAG: ATP-dependent protease LonB, partial [Candidatus Eremiobacteraeota bacterium]|nr:ATP-dependent protease LonB [Candidatus Eremiobacteraeota bacterium]